MNEDPPWQIFKPFYTTKPVGRGTGLGLSTVYGIVKQSGGNIWLYSEPGKGTTFKVYLPAIDAAPDDVGKPVSSVARRSGGETVLVVEDDDQLRRLTHRALAAPGYVVPEAGRGATPPGLPRRPKGRVDPVLPDDVMAPTDRRT